MVEHNPAAPLPRVELDDLLHAAVNEIRLGNYYEHQLKQLGEENPVLLQEILTRLEHKTFLLQNPEAARQLILDTLMFALSALRNAIARESHTVHNGQSRDETGQKTTKLDSSIE